MKNETQRTELQELVAQLVDELMAAESLGETVDIESMAARHPEYASEILSTFRMMRALDQLDEVSLQEEQGSDDPCLKQLGDF